MKLFREPALLLQAADAAPVVHVQVQQVAHIVHYLRKADLSVQILTK